MSGADGMCIHLHGLKKSEQTIDHATFRSFTSYIAEGVGCTAFSFAVEVGVHFRCMDPQLKRPQDFHLTFRSVLGKNVRQPVFHPRSSAFR